MEDAGSTTVGKVTAHAVEIINHHRRLIDTIFHPSEVVGDDRDEMFHCAASQGLLSSVLELLADEGVPCDLPDRFGRTPLHWAAEQGHRNVVLALLRARACVDPRSQRKATPIMLAASKGHEEVVQTLLHYHAGESDCGSLNHHVRGTGHPGSTALHCAAAGGHIRVVEILLNAGFDRGQHDDGGFTPAEVSARKSHSTSVAITRLLLPTSDMGGKMLYDRVDSMWEQRIETVSGLIKAGAFLDWQDWLGNTPLHRAILSGDDGVSRLLLKAGADPNLSDLLDASPMHAAAFGGCRNVVADLLEAGADKESLTILGESPLHRAVVNYKLNVVIQLLDAGVSTEHRDTHYGQTPLSWACKGCLAPVVRVLVEAGADVDSTCFAGLTPLHWACRFIDAKSVDVLLNAGADPGSVDQAAAKDAKAKSSSRSGTIVSTPAAIDVIGLGYPLDRIEDSERPFIGGSVTLAVRRRDLVSVRRIELALRVAKKDRSWRRRGWLTILANRCVTMHVSGVWDKRWESFRGGSGYFLPDCVSAMTNSDTANSCRLGEKLADTQDRASSRLRRADDAMGGTRTSSRQQGHTRGEIEAQNNVGAVLFPNLVCALLELATAEVGVFRRVVTFI